MAISRDEVLHVAKLARLALDEDELERLTAELDKIIEAVGVVSELDLSDVRATSHPLDLVNVWGRTSRTRRFRSPTSSPTRRRRRRTSSGCPRGSSSRHAPPDGG